MATLLRPPRGVTLDPACMPAHIAIIMDGNRRWARQRRLPVIEGHRRGMVALREVTRAASDWGIRMLTVYGFSTENWKREATEISLLLDLSVFFAQNEFAELSRNGVRVNLIGRWEQFPQASREALEKLAAGTAANPGLVLNLAVNYSARSELRDALRRMMSDVRAGTLAPDAIEEETLASYLTTAGMPDPDLVIRPGGESRLSNFLLYQVAHAELVLRDLYWPDFGRDELADAIAEFQ
ncbi:MAG: polyprenyl diphosphate synthase, partial [Vulcanimicrobiaceae bacterium]